MKRLIGIGNRYIEESDWKVITVLKFCLLSLGILIGIKTPRRHRRTTAKVCVVVFLATYIPLMIKLLWTAVRKEKTE